jgi:transcription antitermination factor NusG
MAKNHRLPFQPGDAIKITQGTFAGMAGTVISPEAHPVEHDRP